MFSFLGTPQTAPAKQQPMHTCNTCLGLEHDLTPADGPKWFIGLAPKHALKEKAQHMLCIALAGDRLPPLVKPAS